MRNGPQGEGMSLPVPVSCMTSLMNAIQKTLIVNVDGVEKEHFQTQASLCNVGTKSPAVFFVVPFLAPQDKLANYHVEWDPVLDEWHVTHHPKKFVDSWGMNPKVFGEPREFHQPPPAIPDFVEGEEKTKAQEHDTSETLFNKDEHHATDCFSNQDVEATKNVKDDDEHKHGKAAKPEAVYSGLVKSEASKPGVAEIEDGTKVLQSMVINTKLAQNFYKPAEDDACLSKSMLSSSQLPTPPSTASPTSQKDKTSTVPSAASSPKQKDPPSTSLSSTPEKKASSPQIAIPVNATISQEPKSQSASADPESTGIFSHLSAKGKGGKKGKGKKTKAGKSTSTDKNDKNPQKPSGSSKNNVPLLGTDKLNTDPEKIVGNADEYGNANKIAPLDNETEAQVLSGSAIAPTPTAVVLVPEESASQANPAADAMLISKPDSSAKRLGAVEDMTSDQSPLLTPANTEASPSISVSHLPQQQADVSTSSLSPQKDKESLPAQLSPSSEKQPTVTAPSISPMVSEKPSSSDQGSSPAKNAYSIPPSKGKGKKKGRAGKKMQAKKALAAERDEGASKTDQAGNPKEVEKIPAVPEHIVSEPITTGLQRQPGSTCQDAQLEKNEYTEIMADPVSKVSDGSDSASVVVTEQVKPSQPANTITVKVGENYQEIEDAAKMASQNSIISPVVYNSDRLLLPAEPSMSSEKIEPAVSEAGKDEDCGFKDRDEMPHIVISNIDNKLTENPSNIDPCLEMNVAEGTPNQLHCTLPQGTALSLGMLKAWVNGGEGIVTESPPIQDPTPLTDLASAQRATQVDGLARVDNSIHVDEPVPNANVTQPEDTAEVSIDGDSLATIVKNISDSPPETDADRNVTTAQDVYNPLCLLIPGETSWVVEKMNTSFGGDTSLEELMPKSEDIGQVSTSGGSPIDVVVGQPGSAVEASLDLDANTAQAEKEQLKRKDENKTQVSTNGDSTVAAVEDLPGSPSEAAPDVDTNTVQPFYNPDCLLLPGETSWFLERMKPSSSGDIDEEELRPKSSEQPTAGQHDDHQQEIDADTTLGEEATDRGLESPDDLHDDIFMDAVSEEDSREHELTSNQDMVTGPPEPVEGLPRTGMLPEGVQQAFFEHCNLTEATAVSSHLPMEQANPAVPAEGLKDSEDEAVRVAVSEDTSISRTQKLAQVATMVSEATATLAQSLRNKPSPTESTEQPTEQKQPSEPAKESGPTSILDPEKLVKVATTVPKTREERFLLLELICVLIVRFVGSLFM